MRIAVGCDHAAVDLKRKAIALLESAGHTVDDKGTDSTDPVDYPDYAIAVARSVATGEAESGVLLCGTGIGMAIAANKVRGVRAAAVSEAYSARMAREHNDANVLCVGARVIGEGQLEEILGAWLRAGFQGGTHGERVAKIHRIEGAAAPRSFDTRKTGEGSTQ